MATLRRAVPEDAAALTRLRARMHEAMGEQPQAVAGWEQAAREAFAARLADDEQFVAFVVEDGGEVVACGVGWLEQHLPHPRNLSGRRGHIASMSTDPAHRRQGHARAVFAALMDWFTERDVPRVDLRASPDGRPLYEQFAFRPLGGTTMSWVRS